MRIKRAVAADGRTFIRVGDGAFQQTRPATKALALTGGGGKPPAVKSSQAYAAAMVTRLNEDWPVIHSSADACARWSLRQLRARSRDLERNGGIANAYLGSLEANIIGARGIGVQMKIRKSDGADEWDRSEEERFAAAKPVKGRVIDDPRERKFLKALNGRAGELLVIRSGAQKRAFLRSQEPAWKSSILLAARSLKAGEALYEEEEDGTMTTSGELDRYACYLVEKEFKEFSKRGNCDVTGKHSLMDLCRLALRTSARDGDALLLVYRGYPNRWGVAFQLIEGDYLDDYYNVERLPNGNRIRMGVELDRYGKKVAYWVFANHPGDYGVEGVNSYDPRRRRIAAVGCEPDWYFTDGRPEPVQAIHISRSKRAEETRAVPWMTPAMQLIHHIETYKEAEITAARAEACKHVMYERDAFAADGTALEWEDVNGQMTDEMQPGGATELPPGVHANYIDPKHPNANMPDFLKAMKREVAMALNACYNTLFGDLEAVNYSSIRAGSLEEREAFKMGQAWFGDDVFRPMFDCFLEMALLSRALPFRMSEFDRLNEVELKFRRWPWVDPKNDAETAKLLLELKVTTRSRIIADMSSEDFEETLDELDYEAGYIAAKEHLAAIEAEATAPKDPTPLSANGVADQIGGKVGTLQAMMAVIEKVPAEKAQEALETIFGLQPAVAESMVALLGEQPKMVEAIAGAVNDQAKEEAEAGSTKDTKGTKKGENVKARPAVKSAFMGDVMLGELPAEVGETVRGFVADADETSIVMRYGMTVPELLMKADQHNLETARKHLRGSGVRECKVGVLERRDKFILLMNDRVIDGHHHLAKAERGKVTSSLAVIDLTPLRLVNAGWQMLKS